MSRQRAAARHHAGARSRGRVCRRAEIVRSGLALMRWSQHRSCPLQHGEHAMRLAPALRNGTVWVNDHNRLFAEAESGGYRQSGLGRLHGYDALADFTELKHICIQAGLPKGMSQAGCRLSGVAQRASGWEFRSSTAPNGAKRLDLLGNDVKARSWIPAYGRGHFKATVCTIPLFFHCALTALGES